MNTSTIIDQFRKAMLDAGMVYHGDIIADGVLHRVHLEGDRIGSKNGAYVLHADHSPAGWFQNHKTGTIGTWNGKKSGTKLTQSDLAAIKQAKQQRLKQQQDRQMQAAKTARFIWSISKPSEIHPYLIKKRISDHGSRVDRTGMLVIPLFNEQNEIVNIQQISKDGEKRFLSGGRKKGCFYCIGSPTGTIVIAEGFATAATLHEQTWYMAFVAFDAGNLKPVAEIARQRFPKNKLVIAADNDRSGIGQKKAQEAALAVSAWVSTPPTPGHDWNDHFNSFEVFE